MTLYYKSSLMAACLLFFTACASTNLPRLNTPSGKPEVLINASIEGVKNLLAHSCSATGMFLETTTTNTVICSKQMENSLRTGILQFIIGNSYSTHLQEKVQFSLFIQGAGTKVYIDKWYETQMAGGQVRKVPIPGTQAEQDNLLALKQAFEKSNSYEGLNEKEVELKPIAN